MKSRIRHGLRIAGGIFLLFTTVCVIAYIWVRVHKDSFNSMAEAQINKQVKGKVDIGDLEINFIKTFPSISAELSNVVIRDSLWNVHHHDFLHAEKIYIRFGFMSLLKAKPAISEVIVKNGSIYLYTDECGYCNLNRTNDVGFNKGNSDIPDFKFENTRMIVQNEDQNSYHDFDFEYLKCHLIHKDSSFVFKISLNAFVHGIGFNMIRGSYLKDKSLEGNFYLSYEPGKKVELNEVKLKIDHQPFLLSGDIYFTNTIKSYDLKIQTKKIAYQKATGLLTQSLQEKFKPVDIMKPIDAGANISGLMAPDVVPLVITHFTVYDTDMDTPAGRLTHCAFTGSFTNQLEPLQLPSDENSKFIFNDIKETWENLSFTTTRAEVSNFKAPYLICDVRSIIDLQDLNSLSESSSIRFLNGLGTLDIKFNGPMMEIDSLNSLVNGTFTISDAEVNYMPRNLLFKNCSGVFEFKDEDLIISNFIATAGNTNLTMNGDITNLLALLDKNPEQLVMNWNVITPQLNLSDFISYVNERATSASKPKPTGRNKLIIATENIDRMLSDGIAKLNVKAAKLIYKKFVATNVAASIHLVGNKVLLKNVSLLHAGGSLNLQGSLTNGNHINTLELQSDIKNVDIPGLFYAFDNFGQDAITHQNMKGQLTAKMNFTGSITDKAEVAENSMQGNVDFSIKDGELINFDPVVKIAATAFKKRDFSHIIFGELKNHLDINGSAITIHKMEIRSNVVTLFVEGLYDTKKGTNMSIQVPLSNLSKAENEDLENTGRVGMNIRLWAKTEEDGKLKVSWDPFNKANKKRKVEIRKDSLSTSGLNKQ
ncbi:MAG: AsmA-like C-terminal region-containing protein [Saprospiraceae bacterium]